MSLVTNITTTLLLAAVCAGASIITTAVATVSTSEGLPGCLGWQDELPPPSLLPMETTRDVSVFTSVLQLQSPSQMGPVCLLSLRLLPVIPLVLHT